MQSHPTPSAHVCTTLPPRNLPMRDRYPRLELTDWLATVSECGRVKRTFSRQYTDDCRDTPIGTWRVFEQRTDDQGEVWTKLDGGIHYVVDNFGFLARVNREGGAA